MPFPHALRAAPLLGAAALILALQGCQRGAEALPAAAAASAAAGPAVVVTTVRAQQRDMPVLLTATGAVTPLASVDIRPQSTHPIARVHVKEGQSVTAGQLMFSLDARADEADVAKAQAQMARDQAALADAQRQLQRAQELLAQNFVSQGAVDTALANVQAQQAAVSADRAALDAARLSLSYTRITAPSAGRLGAIGVSPGSSVQANQTTLVTLTQLDPILVTFSLPQRQLADALAALKEGSATVRASVPDAPAAAVPLTGRLTFVDNAVDAATGTIKVKAEFANPDGRLWPGAFVNVAMTARTLAGAVVIPQAAIIRTAREPIVYTVVDGKAVPRPVQLLYAQGEDAAVAGVNAGERIVLDGRQNLRPGSVVAERAREGGTDASGASLARAGAP